MWNLSTMQTVLTLIQMLHNTNLYEVLAFHRIHSTTIASFMYESDVENGIACLFAMSACSLSLSRQRQGVVH